ncbi:MAG: hypothetical protein WA862_06395 [Solirubrobacterales bacterium]
MRAAGLLAVATAALLLVGIPARAELNGEGDLVVTFNSSLEPSALPRQTPVPVAVRVAGDVATAGDPSLLPQLRTIRIEINRQGRLFDRGLPICNVREIQPATERNARRVCGESIIGSGNVALQARIPTQPLFTVKAKLLAFKGPRKDGHKLILAQAYARKPPGAFVLTFRLDRQSGTFGTVMTTTLPAAAQRWAYLTHFDITLHRTYTYRGQSRSYVSAACTAPAGFDTALFPFARATYDFATGQSLTTAVARSCRVAD